MARSGGFHASVTDANAKSERMVGDAGKTGTGHLIHHVLTADERFDADGEIFVGAGFVMAEPGGGMGHDARAVKIVAPAQQGVGRLGKFQNDQPSAGAKNAVKFAQRRSRLLHIADTKGDGDHIAAAIRQGQRLGIAVEKGG